MGVVASASSVGGIVHPIMLNQLIHGRVGFAWGVRVSAFFNLALLAIANMMMRTRLPPQKATSFAQRAAYWRAFFKDKTYIAACIGTFLLVAGAFFPTFYIQLEAIRRGVNTSLAFYTVSVCFVQNS